MRYRSEIDGLRAIAVLSVIFHHAGFTFAGGGYVGVDVFFVISGFLITFLLVRDLQAGRFSYSDFYQCRARRILPALFFVMACCVPVAFLVLLPSQFREFSFSDGATSLFLSNAYFLGGCGIFCSSRRRAAPSSYMEPRGRGAFLFCVAGRSLRGFPNGQASPGLSVRCVVFPR